MSKLARIGFQKSTSRLMLPRSSKPARAPDAISARTRSNHSPWSTSNGSVALSLINGETLECDWYDVPSLTGGNGITIQVYECGTNQPSVANCDKVTAPVLLVLAPVTQGSPQIVQTNDSGFAHVDGLDGNFTLSETGQQPCGVESDDLGADGTLSLSPDRATSVSVFNCS